MIKKIREKLKRKNAVLSDIYNEFQAEILNETREINIIIKNFIENKLDKSKLQKMVFAFAERKCNRLKEKYIEQLYENKKVSPFLLEDRYNLIISLNDVSVKNKSITRF